MALLFQNCNAVLRSKSSLRIVPCKITFTGVNQQENKSGLKRNDPFWEFGTIIGGQAWETPNESSVINRTHTEKSYQWNHQHNLFTSTALIVANNSIDITFKRKLFLKVVCLRVSHPNSTVPVVAASCSASLYSINNIRRRNIRRRRLTVADSLFFFTLLWEGFNCSRKKNFIFTITGHAIDVGDYVVVQFYPCFNFISLWFGLW